MSARKQRLKNCIPPMNKNGNFLSTDEEKAEVLTNIFYRIIESQKVLGWKGPLEVI